jgi:hypothetical protein
MLGVRTEGSLYSNDFSYYRTQLRLGQLELLAEGARNCKKHCVNCTLNVTKGTTCTLYRLFYKTRKMRSNQMPHELVHDAPAILWDTYEWDGPIRGALPKSTAYRSGHCNLERLQEKRSHYTGDTEEKRSQIWLQINGRQVAHWFRRFMTAELRDGRPVCGGASSAGHVTSLHVFSKMLFRDISVTLAVTCTERHVTVPITPSLNRSEHQLSRRRQWMVHVQSWQKQKQTCGR